MLLMGLRFIINDCYRDAVVTCRQQGVDDVLTIALGFNSVDMEIGPITVDDVMSCCFMVSLNALWALTTFSLCPIHHLEHRRC